MNAITRKQRARAGNPNSVGLGDGKIIHYRPSLRSASTDTNLKSGTKMHPFILGRVWFRKLG